MRGEGEALKGKVQSFSQYVQLFSFLHLLLLYLLKGHTSKFFIVFKTTLSVPYCPARRLLISSSAPFLIAQGKPQKCAQR